MIGNDRTGQAHGATSDRGEREMRSERLQSTAYEVSDTVEAIEFYFEKGWTDGLPVIPPTEGSIRAMLEAVGLDPGEEVAFIENRQVSVTAEKVAINAVMAGCKPEYMPVVVAAVEAIGDPRYGYHGPATSTGGSAVFMLVNGPIARELTSTAAIISSGRDGGPTPPSAAPCAWSCATPSGPCQGISTGAA